MKKVLAISSVLLGVVFLAGCGQQPVSQTQPTTPAPAVQQPVANQPAPVENSNWQIYTNAKSAFSISIPKEWTFKEQLPTPFVATEFFGTDKNKRIMLVDRFETTEQANDDVKKDLNAWAKENFINMDLGYGDKGCKDGSVQLSTTSKGNYPAVVVDCPKRNSETYAVFTQDRHYIIESPLDYKNANVNIYNNIYKTFEVK
jgi:hypothetical protein